MGMGYISIQLKLQLSDNESTTTTWHSIILSLKGCQRPKFQNPPWLFFSFLLKLGDPKKGSNTNYKTEISDKIAPSIAMTAHLRALNQWYKIFFLTLSKVSDWLNHRKTKILYQTGTNFHLTRPKYIWPLIFNLFICTCTM